MKHEHIIPIVMSANSEYGPALSVAAYSIVEHTSQEYRYEINILYTELDEKYQKYIKSLEKYNVKILFWDIAKYTKGLAYRQTTHLTIETVYRLYIPLIFPQYKKVLYLDCDLVVLDNVAKIYENSIKIGGGGSLSQCH